MKRKLITIVSIALMSTIFISCEEDNEITPTAFCDAYIKVTNIADKTQYALYGYVYSNVALQSASFETPAEETINLSAHNNNSYVFSNYANDEELYGDAIPTKGEYSFTVTTKDNKIIERTDVLSEEIATIPVITKSIISDSDVTAEWTETINADYYIVRLLDKDNKEIFTTDFISKSTLKQTIEKDTYGWFDGKSLSDAVKLKIMAIKFEDSDSPSTYDVQSIAEIVKELETAE